MNYQELEKLSLADLIALESYVVRRAEELNDLIDLAKKGSDIHEQHTNSRVACYALQSQARREITNRVEKIFPKFTIDVL